MDEQDLQDGGKSRKFRFYEIVTVKESYRRPELLYKDGVIVGVSEGERIAYSVSFGEPINISYFIYEDDLLPTGRFSSADEFFSGDSITVTQHGHVTSYNKRK